MQNQISTKIIFHSHAVADPANITVVKKIHHLKIKGGYQIFLHFSNEIWPYLSPNTKNKAEYKQSIKFTKILLT